MKQPIAWFKARPAFSVVLALGCLVALINPPYAVNDEDRHLARVFELTRGQLIAGHDERGQYHMVPPAYAALAGQYVGVKRRRGGRVHVPEVLEQLHGDAASELARVDGRAGAYPPLMYAPQIVGVGLARFFGLSPLCHLYFGRIASVLAYACTVQLAYALGGPLRFLFLAVGLIPMAMVQAAGVSGDGAVIGSALLMGALVAKGAVLPGPPLTRRELGALIALAAVLTVCKPVYIALCTALLALRWEEPQAGLKRWGFAASTAAAAALVYAAWGRMTRDVPSPDAYVPGDQLRYLVEHPVRFISVAYATAVESADELFIELFVVRTRMSQHVRMLGGVVGALYLQLLLALSWGASHRFLADRPALRRWRSAALWLSAFSGVLATGLGLYIFGTKVGRSQIHGLQGRYFIPLVVFACLALSLHGRPVVARWLAQRGRLVTAYALAMNAASLGVVIYWHYF